MEPVAFKSLSARYTDGDVIMTWTYPHNAPNTVFIYPVYGPDSSRRINTAGMLEKLLRDASNGTRFKHAIPSSYDVTQCKFLVCLGQSGEMYPNLERLAQNPAFIVTVTVGYAKVYYTIHRKKTVTVQ